ncbi:MAG: NAD-dependent epimerase/dehydratase family protein [Legionellaceae bacterium]|nr:NAD-dependent epimerase/dehydratase family protein [Legionellaceae bacterium]
MKILVTGATGFVGKQLVQYLLEHTEATLCLAVRAIPQIRLYDLKYASRVNLIQINHISSDTYWQDALVDCDVVIHLAACVNVLDQNSNSNSKDPLAIFRATNVEGTLNLARQASQAGIKRFIYMSSIKVNGEQTQPGAAFKPDDVPQPQYAYAVSKLEAEQGLMALVGKSAMKVVILRPPLVYGPDVGGNFMLLMALLQKKIPLPFGAINNNKRSFISVLNLVDVIATCITHPQAENQIFLVSDGHDLSTTALLSKLKQLFEASSAWLFPLPAWVLNTTATIMGKQQKMMRLTGSLQLDVSQTQRLLDWQPRESVDAGLLRTVASYSKSKNSILTE